VIADLKPYPEYKESGSRWLAKVPSYWEVRNLRTLIRPRNERSRADLPLLSVAREKGVFVRSLTDTNENHNVIPEDLSNYKVARAGSLVINKMKAWQGSMGIAPCDGIVSPAYFVFDFGIANRAFGQALLRSKPYVAYFGQASDGVRVGQWDLTIAGMRQIPLLVPPPAEQAAIVRFLDWANGRLERAIRAKRKVIALLTEQKQAIIHRAVTRGLDPSVPLKPSGIPWLGGIPQHWDVRKIKSLVATVGGMTPNKGVQRYWIGRTPWVSPKDMKVQEIFNSKDHISDAALNETNICLIKPPAVLIVVRGMILARTFPTAVTRVQVTVNQDMKALLPRPELSADYFAFLLTGIQRELLQLVEIAGHGTCCLRTDSWGNFYLPIPPLEEQQAIRSCLSAELSTLNTAISRLEREIELLREYRTRLVADVVTGKLDVREAASHLPEEAAHGTAEEATDLIDETEPADEEAAV
jgi:type I restriction enzyme, S subunit